MEVASVFCKNVVHIEVSRKGFKCEVGQETKDFVLVCARYSGARFIAPLPYLNPITIPDPCPIGDWEDKLRVLYGIMISRPQFKSDL